MRILILANMDAGLYKFRKELLEVLAKKHKVYFCVPDGEYVEKIKNIGCYYISCTVLERRSTNPVKDLKLLRFYQTVLDKVQPDVVLMYTIKPNVYGGIACGKKGIPYIANVTGLGTSIENGGMLSKIVSALYKAGLKKSQCVFFQNEANKKYFIKNNLVNGKTKLIPGSGVNLDAYCFEQYPPDKDGIRFLFVGRVMKDKGIEELLKAITSIHQKNGMITADVVGPCEENYIEALHEAELEGAIRYHGAQSDVRLFYKNCHCVVLPSYHEGTSNVLLEASSSGRPVIATRVPGCQETFVEGVTGFGCEVKNVGSLFDAMKYFVSISQEQRIKMGNAARDRMVKEFDRKIVVDAYIAEINLISAI